MKRKYLFCLFVVFVYLSAQAQKTTFGVKAGINFANIYSNQPDYSSDMRVGFHVGGGVNLGVNDNFSVTADLLYSVRGAKQKFSTSEVNNSTTVTDAWEETLTMPYLEIPILARYRFTSGLYINGGFSIAFLAGYKDEATLTHTVVNPSNTNVTTTTSSTTDHTGISSTDIGFKFGLGYEWTSGLDLAVNYTLGLSNIIDISGDPYKAHHGVIGITVGYWFGK